MNPLVVIFWIWFACGLAYWGYRIGRRIVARGAPDAERKPTRKELREAQLAEIKAQAEGPGPTERLFQEVLAGRDDAAPPDADAAPTTDRAADPAPTVAELLAGMVWPCDLAPVIDTTVDDLDRRVAFSTTGHAADQVASEVRAGLEALGYEVVVVDDTHFVCTSERGRLTTVVHGDPGVVAARERPGWAALPGGSVVVELTARA